MQSSKVINPINLSGSGISCKTNSPLVYTGSPIIPEVTLTYGNLTFKENVDYTLAFSNNVEPGQGVITITGISSILTGTSTRYFTIKAVSISTLEIEDVPDQTYTGSEIKPSVVVKNGSVTLKEGTDYTLSYEYNTNVTSYAYVYIDGIGRYTGSATKRFKIVPRSITKATISNIADQKYTGSAIKPSVTVKDNGKTLTSGKDYTVSYKNNVKAGTATITIKGKGNFKNSITRKFKII